MTDDLQILTLKGEDILPYLPGLARLGIKLFREYPYLFEMDPADEESYGKRYAECPESVLVIVIAQDKVVGASTAMPLHFDVDAFKKPFNDNGIPAEKVFYLGESLLLPEYRGRGLYRHFFDERERAAKKSKCTIAAFSTVDRGPNDPRQPAGYVPLDEVWQHFGYEKHPEIYTNFDWKDVGEVKATSKRLVFWLKKL